MDEEEQGVSVIADRWAGKRVRIKPTNGILHNTSGDGNESTNENAPGKGGLSLGRLPTQAGNRSGKPRRCSAARGLESSRKRVLHRIEPFLRWHRLGMEYESLLSCVVQDEE